MDLFSAGSRDDRRARRANEPLFAFLDRTSSTHFAPVRTMLHDWLSSMDPSDRAPVIGSLHSGDDQDFYSAFWELYLHQVLVGSGLDVEIHPPLPGTNRRPDFLVHAARPFYLEAVVPGVDASTRATTRRLEEVENVLEMVRVNGYVLSFEHHNIGPEPLRAADLARRLQRHFDGFGHDGPRDPYFRYRAAGWDLEFTALATSTQRTGPMIGIKGAGRAEVVNNEPGLRRVLDKKARAYGSSLPHPLVTAVLSNTEFPTRMYELVPVLYGLHGSPPPQVSNPSDLAEPGHWRDRRGWRRGYNPAVVVAVGLLPWTVHSTTPWAFKTLEPGAETDLDLSWASDVDINDAQPLPVNDPPLQSLGLDPAWFAGDADLTE